MKWKFYAIISAAFLVIGLMYDRSYEIKELIGTPITIISNFGVIAYAFRIRRAYTRLWTPFAWLFAVWSIGEIGIMVYRGAVNGSPVYATVGATLIAGTLFYLDWLAVHRLGRAEYA
jgi:hypothetical protein